MLATTQEPRIEGHIPKGAKNTFSPQILHIVTKKKPMNSTDVKLKLLRHKLTAFKDEQSNDFKVLVFVGRRELTPGMLSHTRSLQWALHGERCHRWWGNTAS